MKFGRIVGLVNRKSPLLLLMFSYYFLIVFVSDGLSGKGHGSLQPSYTCRVCGKVFNRAGVYNVVTSWKLTQAEKNKLSAMFADALLFIHE